MPSEILFHSWNISVNSKSKQKWLLQSIRLLTIHTTVHIIYFLIFYCQILHNLILHFPDFSLQFHHLQRNPLRCTEHVFSSWFYYTGLSWWLPFSLEARTLSAPSRIIIVRVINNWSWHMQLSSVIPSSQPSVRKKTKNVYRLLKILLCSSF